MVSLICLCAASFPRLTSLTVVDFRLPEEKWIQRSMNGTESTVEFQNLADLSLISRYGDYAAEFLVETNTIFSI